MPASHKFEPGNACIPECCVYGIHFILVGVSGAPRALEFLVLIMPVVME